MCLINTNSYKLGLTPKKEFQPSSSQKLYCILSSQLRQIEKNTINPLIPAKWQKITTQKIQNLLEIIKNPHNKTTNYLEKKTILKNIDLTITQIDKSYFQEKIELWLNICLQNYFRDLRRKIVLAT